MAYPLNESDRNHHAQLNERRAELLNEFREKWKTACRSETLAELENMQAYLEACSRSEVDDTLDNIHFMADKAAVLRQLLA